SLVAGPDETRFTRAHTGYAKGAVQHGRSKVREAKKNERHVCGRARVGERPVSQRRIVLAPYGEPLRFTSRGITRDTFMNAAEPVRRPECRTEPPPASRHVRPSFRI